MDNYVLRKSYGPYSAGTRLDEIEGCYYLPDSEEVPPFMTVKRRTMQMMVPKVNSKMRRRRRKALNELTELSQEMPGGYR